MDSDLQVNLQINELSEPAETRTQVRDKNLTDIGHQDVGAFYRQNKETLTHQKPLRAQGDG